MRVGQWLNSDHLREATRTGLRNLCNIDGKRPVGMEIRANGKGYANEARLLYEVDEDREPLPVRVVMPEYYWDGSS